MPMHVGDRRRIDEILARRAILVGVVVLPVLHEQADDLEALRFSIHAATDESTPPDMPTMTRRRRVFTRFSTPVTKSSGQRTPAR